MRYKPAFAITVGSDATFHQDTMTVDVRQGITNMVPSFEMDTDNRFDRHSAVQWNDSVIISLDGTRVLKGRVDQPVRTVAKKGARTIHLTGRGDAGALQDLIISKHYAPTQDVNALVTDLINTYNDKKGSADPTITIGSILPAPGTIQLGFLWRKKSVWDCFKAVGSALGAPVAIGGLDIFHDFYVDPFDAFYFEPIGQRSSGVNLGGIGGKEIKKRDWTIDSLPVKNDIWVVGEGSAGTIPLTMQIGYNGGVGDDRTDPWSEGNAVEYGKGDNCNTITDDGTYKVIGSQSIKVVFTNIANGARGYFYMAFPFNTKWPAQPPYGLFNVYNDVDLVETMGEITGVGYFIRNPAAMDHLIEVKDGNDLLAQSEKVHLDAAPPSTWFTPVWKYVQLPFGPSANYKAMSETDQFDWSQVQEVRFVFYGPNISAHVSIDMWFDGFRFIKPLVVNRSSGATTKRNHIANETWINTYKNAKIWAQALLETMMNPQQYYDFENIGRADIPVGYKVTAEGKELLVRELRYQFAKDTGWIVTLKAFEAT